MRFFILLISIILGWLIFGVGLISPLTPSEGIPGIFKLLCFSGIPIGIFIACFFRSSSTFLRILLGLQALLIIVITFWLLSIQTGLFKSD